MTANTTLHLLLFSRVLLSNNDSKHNPTFTAFYPCLALQQWRQTQHYIYRFLSVSCSPTMTTNTTLHLLHFIRVLLSNNDGKHNTTFTAFYLCLALQQWQQTQLYIYCILSVSCSPTMTANTTLHLLLFLCLALQQWQQTQLYIYCILSVSCSPTMTANTTLHLPLFPCVLLSNNDSKHQYRIYLYHFQAFVSQWTLAPSQVIVTISHS